MHNPSVRARLRRRDGSLGYCYLIGFMSGALPTLSIDSDSFLAAIGAGMLGGLAGFLVADLVVDALGRWGFLGDYRRSWARSRISARVGAAFVAFMDLPPSDSESRLTSPPATTPPSG